MAGYIYETHMHTSEVSKCGASTAAEQIKAYKDRGYAGVIVTDHFVNGHTNCPQYLSWEDKTSFQQKGYIAAKNAGDCFGLDVFFAWEYPDHGSDFLTYGLGADFILAHPEIDTMPIGDYCTLVKACGGYVAQAHPYRDEEYVMRQYPISPKYLDGVEVFNSSLRPALNAKARAFAERHSLAMQSGSDSHYVILGFESGIRLQKKAESIHDIVSAIRNGEAELICK